MKNLAAAALILCAFSATASNFRGGDQVYIPAAGNFQGASGRFVSDVYLANLDEDEVKVSVIFQPLGENIGGQPNGLGQEFKDIITLQPLERREFKDFIPNVLGLTGNQFGQLIFNACVTGQDCSQATQTEDGVSDHFRRISATSRVYSFDPNKPAPQNTHTTGQLFTGIPWYHFVSMLQNTNSLDKIFITGLRQTGDPGQAGTFRSNIGLVNASQYSSTTLTVKLYQGRIRPEDLKSTFVITLGPLGSIQRGFSQMFSGFTGENYFVTVEQTSAEAFGTVPQGCISGCPAFLAYGSVLDNGSGDATTLEAQYLVPLSDDAITVIYPSGVPTKPSVRRSVRH